MSCCVLHSIVVIICSDFQHLDESREGNNTSLTDYGWVRTVYRPPVSCAKVGEAKRVPDKLKM